ncbi:exonuclease, partial [Boeremia exigua]|uniref:exonuclease n=1 Tax=Boeremia exigua TaxID=749465 RepID=UPI001E8ED893
IVLDCEMIGTGPKGKISELARLSAVDFLTGELLIDTLVHPQHEVTDWRTKWSGITAEMVQTAISSGTILTNATAARTELFKHMDSETILVGHALHNDLHALRIHHNQTFDSSTLASVAVGACIRKLWGLKALCKELLEITVQDNGYHGHDAVEDALAAREL